MMSDNTKFLFRDNEYNKGRLVLAVVTQYLKDESPTYLELIGAFPDRLQGGVGTLISEESLNKKTQISDDPKRRYFVNNPLMTSDGKTFYVSNQWGFSEKGFSNIGGFISNARELGYSVVNLKFRRLFDSYKKNPSNEWIQHYKEQCEKLAGLKGGSGDDVPEEILETTWLRKQNWVSNVGPGAMTKDEYLNVKKQLTKITRDIINDPSENMLLKTIEWGVKAKEQKLLNVERRAVIRRVFSQANPAQYSTVISDKKLGELIKILNIDYGFTVPTQDNWAIKNIALMEAVRAEGLQNEDDYLVNTFVWHLYEKLIQGDAHTDTTTGELGNGDDLIVDKANLAQLLNRILYGPPGTGKTYHTVDHSIRIIDPIYFEEHKNNRTQLKSRFDELVEQKRIGFVTFHQSFSYEDFVEGIRADTDDGEISYAVQGGVFKELCERAVTGENSLGIDMAIERIIEYLENNTLILSTATGKKFSVGYRGGRTFQIQPQDSVSSGVYPASIANIKKVFRGASRKDIYNPSYVYSILEYLKSQYQLEDNNKIVDRKPVVLIIDEINRGNTANIFGELITLIEPSKRAGADEALEVMLPYSKEKFSVPNNLYIIGTMNTADRSLALLDTALRRRFKFVEMMPDPQLLDGIFIDGIDVRVMFETINKRISILYDREHMIGHSFFLPLKENGSFESLREIFENDILPLLEEYFFEDWNKIGRALGDNDKPPHLKMIQPTMTEQEMEDLLGDEDNGINSIQYQRNDEALNNPQAYISIYQTV